MFAWWSKKHPKQRRFHTGPLDKTRREFYRLPLYAVYADEKKLEIMTGAEKKSTYSSWMATYFMLAGIALTMILLDVYIYSTNNYPWPDFTYWLVYILPLIIFTALGLYYRHKYKHTPIGEGPVITIDRVRGEIRTPKILWYKARTFSFDSLEAYLVSSGPSRFGAVRYFINLYPYDAATHTFGKGFHMEIGPVTSLADAQCQWSFLCQYMNRDEHLPMVPALWDAIIRTEFGGYQDEQSTLHKLAVLRHEWAMGMRGAGHTGYLDIEPELDPQSPNYDPYKVDDHNWIQQAAVHW